MFATTVSAELAAQLELCELNAWRDMYAAAPSDFVRQFQLEILEVEDVVFTRCKTIPFVHFNCVKNFGMGQPATEALLDTILTSYRDAGIQHFTFYHIPHCQPSSVPKWFKSRNLQRRGGWDRIYRGSHALTDTALKIEQEFVVEKITRANAAAWAAYIDAIYGLPTAPWLLALVERAGWHHYLLRRGTQIVAVRSMFIDSGDMAWLGIDAPVPGIMAPSFGLDDQLCQVIVRDGLEAGAKYFVADIEAPDMAMNTPAYHHFERLGFRRPYFRSHFSY